jgi:transcription termination factor Rho
LEEIFKLRNNMTGDSLEYTSQFVNFLKKTKNNDQVFKAFKDVSFGGKTVRRNQKR